MQQQASSSLSSSAFPPLMSSSAAAASNQAVEDAVVARYVAAGASSLRSSADTVLAPNSSGDGESLAPNTEQRRRTGSLGPGMLSTANIAGGVPGTNSGARSGAAPAAAAAAATAGNGHASNGGSASPTPAAPAAASGGSAAASALSSSSGNSSGGGYAAAANRRGKAMNTERMQLDVDAIELGDDKRTTLMVKNIPNKYSQRMLIEAFEDSAGLFDFLYLPIDFSNRCFPEHDHQVLTSDGFRFLDEIEARVEMQRGSVVDWRGLAVATYDERTRQLVYRQPRELVINEPGAAMVELGGGMAPVSLCAGAPTGAPSVVATRNHELFVRVESDAFRKATCDELLASGVKHVRMLAAAANGVAMADGDATDFPFELYGFCVGSGCAVERVAPACVVVTMRDGAARDFFDARLAAAQFVAGVDYEVSANGAVYTVWRAALVQACVSTPPDAFGALVWSCDKAALRRLVAGMCAARGTAQHIDTDSVRLRDELVRLLLHAGFVTSFELAVSDTDESVQWRVCFGDDAAAVEPRVAVSHESFKCESRTWCFDMSSGAPSALGDNANDGFVVVRRAQRVARARYAGLMSMLRAHAKALRASDAFVDSTGVPMSRAAMAAAHEAEVAAYLADKSDSGANWSVVQASRPTIQGNCNVGYAFINFTSYKHIPAFFNKFHGRSWPKFNSVKICALAYARIQGKQSLITHFQNSRLLSEEKKCRPIIFGLDADGVATIEEQWPSAEATPSRRGGGSGGSGTTTSAGAASAADSRSSSSSSSSTSNTGSSTAGASSSGSANDSARNRRAGRGRRGGGGSGGGGGQ
jgi:hypothetical protein